MGKYITIVNDSLITSGSTQKLFVANTQYCWEDTIDLGLQTCCKSGKYYRVLCDSVLYSIHEDDVVETDVEIPLLDQDFRKQRTETILITDDHDHDPIRSMKPEPCCIEAEANIVRM